MSQAKAVSQTELVKYVITLLAHGRPEDWNRQYRTRAFEQAWAEKGADALVMDFEYADRKVFYQCINGRFVQNQPVDYLEFGVAGGDSFRSWLALNHCPESRFWGFDSFEGLPEDWNKQNRKGAFSQGGNVPRVQDPRAAFVKGVFQDTVDDFSRGFEPRNRLVIHMDADLYSSTLYCFMQLNRHIAPGTIVLFDEFTARNCTDEFAALQDWCAACWRDYRFIATRRDHVKLAIEVTR